MPIPMGLGLAIDFPITTAGAPAPGTDALLLTDVADNLLLTDGTSLLLLAV